MTLLHKTILKDVEYKSGEYPEVLRDAVTLLVEERKNFIPVYMSGAMVNVLMAKVGDARRREGEVGEVIESLNVNQEIEVFKKHARNMVRGMAQEWDDIYALGALLSDDVVSQNQAIKKPEDRRFSFELIPKAFDLGLSGRLLEDSQGRRYQESLVLPCDIYDAYNLAHGLNPQRIVVIDSHGNQTVVYEDGKELGKKETLKNSAVSEKPTARVYVFSEDQIYSDDMQVLPTNGLKVVFSDFYEKVRRYDRGAMLFGHKYSGLKEFLAMARVLDQHVIWDICAAFQTQYGGHDVPLIDCERVNGLENSNGKRFPENKNRLQFIPDRGSLDLGTAYLRFDRATAVQALMSLDDVVTDVWFDPWFDRHAFRDGWDIAYDRRRGITPDKPIRVMGAANAERYHVLKGYVGKRTN